MKKKYSKKDVGCAIAVEGVEYTVCDYLDPDQITDPKLRKLCQTARDSIKEIEKYLEKYIEEI